MLQITFTTEEIQITFTTEEIDALHYERFHHPHPRVQRKMEALYLKSQNYPHKEITKLLRITEPILLGYLRDYKDYQSRITSENSKWD